MKSGRRSHGISAVVLVLAFTAASAHAFSFSPMVTFVGADEAPARVRYTVQNDTQRAIAVQISAHDRHIDQTGNESTSPTDDLFVFPSQIVLGPGRTQEVTVEWTGGHVQRERAFRIIATQLPVNLGTGNDSRAQLRVNLEYVTSLYVRPPGASPQFELIQATVDMELAEFRIHLRNAGAMHGLLRDIAFDTDGWPDGVTRLVPASRFEAGSNVVLPEGERILSIPLERLDWDGEIAPDISVDIVPHTP